MSARRWALPSLVLAAGVAALSIGTWATAVEYRTQTRLTDAFMTIWPKFQARDYGPMTDSPSFGTYPTGFAWEGVEQRAKPAIAMIEAEFPTAAAPVLYRFPGERMTWFRKAVGEGRQLHSPPIGPIGLGAGFLIDNGRILTVAHLFHGLPPEVTFYARFPDGTRTPAMIEAFSPSYDAALLYIEGRGRQGLPIADRRQVKPGAPVMTIGNPGGQGWQANDGVLIGAQETHVSEPAGLALPSWEITIPLTGGNSGGPLLSLAGEVVGIAAYSTHAGSSHFAIPADLALASITEARRTRGPGVYCPAPTTGGTRT